MDIKELIKAGIKKRIKANRTVNGFPAGTLCAIRIETYEELLSFIDSLSDEPVSEALEAASEAYQKKARKHLFDNSPIGTSSDAFKAGAEWRKNREWKPSDEQMMELQHGIDFIEDEWGDDEPVLRSLYEDLKKLKED